MPINKEYILKARDETDKIRAHNKQLEQQRHAEVLEKIPGFSELEIKLADTMTEVISLVVAQKTDATEKMKAVSEKNLAIQREMETLLVENGFGKDYLNQIYTCTKCFDTGTFNGEWCDCLKKRANKLAADELNNRSPLKPCTFESFDLSLYADEPKGDSPREIMKDVFTDCVEFAEKFSGQGNGIFMIGGTGLGKTHLSLAIAKKILQKDYCVVYNSAPELLRAINNDLYGKGERDTLSVISECDLLILDDLGAENPTENNLSMLYEIINNRICQMRPMIVSTNFDGNELKARYNDRILSRLFSMKTLMFAGSDNRLK